MVPLDPKLRGALEKAVLAARAAADRAAGAALQRLAVAQRDPFPGLSPEERRLRNALRARARQLGGGVLESGLGPLTEEIAYEQWHRMLFARFLAENGLLRMPDGTEVTLEECADLAIQEDEPDGWALAARYAALMLPGIFRVDDPSAQVRFAPEGRAALESIVIGLAPAVFTSDDGLGWVYQFWQAKRKQEVSKSGRKIEKLDLAAYSQLFTEDYMVRFLLENSLGAWWAARHPDSPLVKEFTYLRFKDEGDPTPVPAAGTFPGWPERAAEVTVMDPCCGSGHFLVAAFEMLRQMRMEEEGLGAREAGDAVLRDNLFGLELDPRCVQIAAFALALAAWRTGGYRVLPPLNLACSGIPVSGQLDEWTKLAGDDLNLRNTLERLYHLFRSAPDLGSLVNPADVPLRDRMFAPDFSKVGPLLERALAKERTGEDPVAAVFGEAAVAAASAAELLGRQYSLVATNVPYLTRNKQSDVLKEFCGLRYKDAKADLATVFLDRCRQFSMNHGSYSVVSPQNWLFLSVYKKFRINLLESQIWEHLSRLGPGAFDTICGHVVNTILTIISNAHPSPSQILSTLDVSSQIDAVSKGADLQKQNLVCVNQRSLLSNVNAMFSTTTASTSTLSRYAAAFAGLQSGDYPRFGRCFWEMPLPIVGWSFQLSTVKSITDYGGREHVFLWEDGKGQFYRFVCDRLGENRISAWIRGTTFTGKTGVAVTQMTSLPVTLYAGELYDNNVAVMIPRFDEYLPAIWHFCSSGEFAKAVRELNQKLSVDPGYLTAVAFDYSHWRSVAEAAGPMPEPYSDDPTQWLFKGDPADSTEPLHVAVARLLGYRWPQQEADRLSSLADEDGIVPLVPVAREEPAHTRVRAVLSAAFGDDWSAAREARLLAEVGFDGKPLELWLRDGFFEQHSKLFHQRPFIWHLWDGRRDGFSALVNYHRLDGATLDKLIYTYLGDWIRLQREARDAGVAGAEGRLVAAEELKRKLEAIRQGERDYDIYVRWKPLHRQPLGWDPDLNDGVRLNIRPFVTARVLRSKVNVNWNKDRGLNPDGSERINDRHLSLAEKRAARNAAGILDSA